MVSVSIKSPTRVNAHSPVQVEDNPSLLEVAEAVDVVLGFLLRLNSGPIIEKGDFTGWLCMLKILELFWRKYSLLTRRRLISSNQLLLLLVLGFFCFPYEDNFVKC